MAKEFFKRLAVPIIIALLTAFFCQPLYLATDGSCDYALMWILIGISELLPSEQAAVISIHYSEMISQGRRNDIDHELRLLSGCEQAEAPPVERIPKNSRKELAEAYSLSSTTVARLLKL